MAEQPNEASKKSKAEGDRWDEAQEKSGISNRSDERALGPLDTPRRYERNKFTERLTLHLSIGEAF